MIRLLISILLAVLIIIIWLFPILISFYTHNFWFILLYIAWTYPAILLTVIIGAIIRELF